MSRLKWKSPDLLSEVERLSRTPVSACYQCHKCSSGCPVAPDADLLSSQVMRLIHFGAEEEVLGCEAIWLCASCAACSTRCPMGIDIAGVMDTLRMLAVRRHAELATRRDHKFARSFLGSVRRHGRAFEVELLLAYKLSTGTFMEDVDKAREMLKRGKLKFFPQRSSVGEVRRIFRRARREETSR